MPLDTRESHLDYDNGNVGTGAQTGEQAMPSEFRKNPLRSIWRRRWVAVSCLIIGVMIGYLLFVTSPPVYEGRARILVSQTGPKLIQQDFAGSLGTGGATWLRTQCDLIRSPVVLHQVAETEAARQLQMFRENPELAANVRVYLQGATLATVGQLSEIITVSVRGPDPDGTAVLANLVVKAYQDFNDKLKQTSASEVLRRLREKKDENDLVLQGKYRDRLKFQRENATLSFNREVRNPVLERVGALSSALTQAELERVRTKAELDSVKSMLGDPDRVRQLLASPQYRGDGYAMRRELREMQNSLEALSGTYLPGNDRIAAQLQKMQRTKAEIENEEKSAAQAVVADIERRYAAYMQQVEQYGRWLNEEQSQVLNVNSKQADFDQIAAEISRMEKYSDQLADQMKSISLAESAGAMNVNTVEQAESNSFPVEPNRTKLLFVGAIAGLLVGAVLGLLLEFFDQRMRSAEEIKSVVGLPIMGVVPHIIQSRTQSGRGLMVHVEPMSDVAEAYRTIRTAIYFGVPGGSIKTLLITSPAPGDGKTTLAANLATAMAQAGNRVILLDCDFRKPSLHRVFEVDKHVGLSNVLAGEVTIDQATQPTRVSGLSIVPCGPIPANPSEILNSQAFLDLLESLGKAYDLVLIDSPPVLPVTDARVLAASCDGVLLALRAEKTTRSAAVSARDQLASVGGRVLGLVVNDVSRRRGVYSSYYADEGRYAYYHYGPRRAARAPGAAPANGDGVPATPPESPSAG